MSILRCILLVIGASSLGLVTCVVAAICVVGAFTSSGSGEDWGSAIYAVFFAFCGGMVGGMVGLVGSLRWISQRGCEPWTLTTWIGVLLGLVFALVVRFSGALHFCLLGDLIKWLLGIFFFLAAAACLGGLLGSFAGTWIERQVARTFERFAKRKSDRTISKQQTPE